MCCNEFIYGPNLFQEKEKKRIRDGSLKRKAKNFNRERMVGHKRISIDYFSASPYPEHLFRRIFRMGRDLLLLIASFAASHYSYFQQKCDVFGLLGLSTIQKTTSARKQLAYGISTYAIDEYCRLGESTTQNTSQDFVERCLKRSYLKQPTKQDIQRQFGN